MEFNDDEIERFSAKFINKLIDLITQAIIEMAKEWEVKENRELMIYISY